jgi:diguanylate cyclase (GGDEF)-like protein/PAS domain S-box-containing protein
MNARMGAPTTPNQPLGAGRWAGLLSPAALFAAAGLLLVGLYALRLTSTVDAVLLVGACVAACVTLGASALRRSGGDRLPWALMAACQALWAVGWVVWQAHVVHAGHAPPPGTLSDLLFLAGDACQVGALALLFRARARGSQLLLDTLLLVGAVAVVTWPTLIGPYMASSTLPVFGRSTQIAYAVADMAVLALLLRGFLWCGRDATLNLVAAAMCAYLAADVAWNWLTLAGAYDAGSASDLGWLAFSVLLGAAGLRPATRPVRRETSGTSLSPSGIALLAVGGLTGPAIMAYERLRHGHTSLVVLAVGTLLSLVVVLRLLVVVRSADRLSRALEDANRRFRSLVENLPLVTYIDEVNEQSSNIYTSPQIEALCGYTREEWQNDPELFVKTLHPEDREATLAQVAECVRTGAAFEGEYRLLTKSGGLVWVRDQSVIVTDDEGRPVHAQGYLLDITARKAAEEEISQLAYHDQLTGLANRLLFERQLTRAVERCAGQERGVAVLYINLDDFKLVNDSFGHATGDAVLRRVADGLRKAATGGITVAHHGGDEFSLLIEAPIDELDALAVEVAERTRDALRQPLPVGPIEVTISASIGISLYPVDGADAATLLKHADSAMHAVKQHGRDAWRRYAGEADDALNKLELVSRLRGAIDRKELRLLYQPIVDLPSGSVVGAEALIRWHSEGTVISPIEFIPLAEHTGLIRPMTHWIVDEVAATIRRFQDHGLKLPVAINVSPAAFDASLPARLLDAAARHGIDPALLGVEITESGIMSDPEQANSVLDALARHGIRASIDDFGTGHSSLSRLAVLPVDTLKIDRSFIRDLNHATSADAIVTSIVQLARALGREPLAEGIETEEQRRLLVAQGCLRGQGFLFSRPIEADALIALATPARKAA